MNSFSYRERQVLAHGEKRVEQIVLLYVARYLVDLAGRHRLAVYAYVAFDVEAAQIARV